VMRLKPLNNAQPFTCDVAHEGSIFMYKLAGSPTKSYLCYCWYGNMSPQVGLQWRSVSSDEYDSECWNALD
jgi:hypothetical protein